MNADDVIMRSSSPSRTEVASERRRASSETEIHKRSHGVPFSRYKRRLAVDRDDARPRSRFRSCLLTELLEQLSGGAVTTLNAL